MELLIVVGIIVALAGVVIPAVSQFASKGETGAMVEEYDNVQSAMDYMMVDSEVSVMNPSPSTSKNTWDSFPTGPGVPPLDSYLRKDTTTYFYCWDASGRITEQHASATSCP